MLCVCSCTKVTLTTILEYWAHYKVLRRNGSGWIRSDTLPADQATEIDGLFRPFQASVIDSKLEAMRVFWPYIVGMLTNMGQLSVDRIFQLLKVFVQAPNKFTRPKEDLDDFMALMVQEEKVCLEGPLYVLNRKSIE